MATGDYTHPEWFAELREKLEPAEPGLFRLKKDIAAACDKQVPDSCRRPVRFVAAGLFCRIREGRRKSASLSVFKRPRLPRRAVPSGHQNGPAVLVCVDKGLGTRPVNQPWDAGGERVDIFTSLLV